MDKETTSRALVEAKALVAELEAYDGSVEQHSSLLRRADKTRTAMEGPYEIATRWLENMSCAAAVNLLVRTEGFEHFPVQGSITAKDLASACKVDPSAFSRALRILVGYGIFEETGKDEYAHNALSLAFEPKVLGGFVGVSVDTMDAWIATPNFFKTHEPWEIYDIRKSPFAFAVGHEGKTYYEVIDLDPQQRDLWNITLQNMNKNFPIVGMFPFQNLEEQVKKEPERPFIVDIGGGRGQALLAIKEHLGDSFEGKFILQDLPSVISSLKPEETPGIEPMVYDIWTPQTVKGAHLYFMRRLLHDFYDPEVVKILRNTASAMAPDSRLIICDMLVPDRVDVGGPMTLYWLDFALLAIGGKERSLDDFKKVVDEAGLEIVDIYHTKGEHTVQLETRLRGVK